MKLFSRLSCYVVFSSVLFPSVCHAIVRVEAGNCQPGEGYPFSNIPGPCRGDSAERGKFELSSGYEDPRSGGLSCLNDGHLAEREYAPDDNFFLQGDSQGRLMLDLQRAEKIIQINSYSTNQFRHGPQAYVIYASDGKSPSFMPRPPMRLDPQRAGWKRIAEVNTGLLDDGKAWLRGVSVSDSQGALGDFRYLLFDVSSPAVGNRFGNTFFSEVDVIAADDTTRSAAVGWAEGSEAAPVKTRLEFGGGSSALHLDLDASAAPDLADWLVRDMGPFVAKWYPKLIEQLPGSGFQALNTVKITLVPNIPGTTMNGHSIAGTGGRDLFSGRINLSVEALRSTHLRTARGMLVHELTHVIQHYRQWSNRPKLPVWLIEGIAEYMRIYLYEPELEGTLPTLANARYDEGYVISARFLRWVAEKYDKKIVLQMNSALRDDSYSDGQWERLTGKSLQSLGAEWTGENSKAALP